jgi:hypothetical protein
MPSVESTYSQTSARRASPHRISIDICFSLIVIIHKSE